MMMSLDTLLHDLREGTTEQRQHAAQALRNYGAAAVEPLCLALRDKDLNVRVVAAESLRQVGDERAVQPLMEALRECFVRRSVRWQIVIGMVVPILQFALIAWALRLEQSGSWLIALILSLATGAAIVIYHAKYAPRDAVCRAITEALARIAECNPTPELRSIIPDLKAIAADGMNYGKQTRAASRQAAQRIEALTEKLKNLPLPAAAPAPDVATLPRSVDAPEQETERLPRVTANE